MVEAIESLHCVLGWVTHLYFSDREKKNFGAGVHEDCDVVSFSS
jgi:hypothetical protein